MNPSCQILLVVRINPADPTCFAISNIGEIISAGLKLKLSGARPKIRRRKIKSLQTWSSPTRIFIVPCMLGQGQFTDKEMCWTKFNIYNQEVLETYKLNSNLGSSFRHWNPNGILFMNDRALSCIHLLDMKFSWL